MTAPDLRVLADRYTLAAPLSTFPLEHAGLNNANVVIQTADGAFVLRAYDSLSYADPASIAYEHRLLDWLATRDLPFAVPVPLATRDGARCIRGAHGRISLAPRLPGTPLARQHYDPEIFGAALGELRVALGEYRCEPRPPRALFDELFRFGGPVLDAPTLTPAQIGLPPSAPDDGRFDWWREEAARLEAFVAGPYRALPWRLCHNDVTPNSVLAEGGIVTGVLDFEIATPTARAMDFATSLRMVMRFWEPTAAWAEIRSFCGGYARRASLTDAEIAATPELLRLRSAITVLWWIGRAAATGEPGPIPERIASAQKLARWLELHEARLLDLVAGTVNG